MRIASKSIPKLVLPTLLISLSVATLAQQLPQDTSGQSADCADPMSMGSAQCQGAIGQSQAMGGQRSGMAAGRGVQPSINGLYSDNQNMLGNTPGALNLQFPLPPEPLTEFQKFVASTTGSVLPIYGADLFRNVPSTFSPLNLGPVPSTYILGPGDELRIRIWGQISFEAQVSVDRSGDIYLPYIGTVHVAGLHFSELDQHLRAAVGRVYRNFDLTVDMGEIRSIQVYVAGQARRPGVYTVSSLSTLVDALFASGGPSAQGSLRHIELRRNGAIITDFDLYDLIAHGDKSKDVKLLPEDVIFIPPVGPEVAVTGSVRTPAIYELRGNETLGDLLKDTGGITAVASSTHISIEKIENHQGRQAMNVAYDKAGLATLLANGDVIHVNSIVPSYSKTVTLRGNVANPGRFAWHPGMRISELIPDKDSLITRNYWWRRAQQGLPAHEFEPTSDLSQYVQPDHPFQLEPENNQQYSSSNGQPWDQQTYPSNSSSNSGASDTGTASKATPSRAGGKAGVENPNVQQSSRSGQSSQYAQQYDQYGRPINQNQYGQPNGPQQDQYGNIVQAPYTGNGSTLASHEEREHYGYHGATQLNQVRILAPEIDWDYAVIERLDPQTLKTKLLPFDLGKLVLDHDQTQNLELQPGDVVTIFSEADIQLPRNQQTKLVRLEGEFVHAGIYSAKPGETLRELVQAAGGLTPGAYLYGSEFTRNSTRALQQARIDDYIQTVDLEMQRGNISMVANGVGGNVDQSGRTAASVSTQALLARLRRVRATGRIVLEFKPGADNIDDIPNIPLEDGDVFVVPAVPASVNVVGAVYNQNSFLYDRYRRVSAYLRLAGGPARSADTRHAFIIRADGEVVSRSLMNGPWGNSFDNLHMNPGDTIVIPDKSIKVPLLRSISGWSSMFSQLALGVAYLTILP